MDLKEQIQLRITEIQTEIDALPARKQQEFQIELAALTVSRDELRKLLRIDDKEESDAGTTNQAETTS